MTHVLNVEQRIQATLLNRLHLQSPEPDVDLFQTGVLDSLSFVDMLVALEAEFSIQIPLDQVDLDDFRSIAAIAAYIESATTSKAPLGKHSTV
jgi:D-alanine--poly(phosphoribitol) ligase subunit 2